MAAERLSRQLERWLMQVSPLSLNVMSITSNLVTLVVLFCCDRKFPEFPANTWKSSQQAVKLSGILAGQRENSRAWRGNQSARLLIIIPDAA
jgi:hypothetical protein